MALGSRGSKGRWVAGRGCLGAAVPRTSPREGEKRHQRERSGAAEQER